VKRTRKKEHGVRCAKAVEDTRAEGRVNRMRGQRQIKEEEQ